LDTDPASRSDWLHEREWRIPILPGYSGLRVLPETVLGILIGDRSGEPVRPKPTGWFFDPSTGELGTDPTGYPDMAPGLPDLWSTMLRLVWNREAGVAEPL
jgi:hypothetical protein